jgi:hypothetical protein
MKNKLFIVGMFSVMLAFGLVVSSCASTKLSQIDDFSEVVDVPGLTKDQLFVKTNLWAVSYFIKADSVIEFSDKDAGTISGKYIGAETPIMGGFAGRTVVRSTFVISIKDGKVKVDLKPGELISYNNIGQQVSNSSLGASINSESLTKNYDDVVQSLKQALTKNSDW